MELLVNGGFPHESWEEYAEHSLTHDDLALNNPEGSELSGIISLREGSANLSEIPEPG